MKAIIVTDAQIAMLRRVLIDGENVGSQNKREVDLVVEQLEDKPLRQPAHDGIYPRCVWCNGEIYGPAVIAYSKGEIPCAAAGGCGRRLPREYVKLA